LFKDSVQYRNDVTNKLRNLSFYIDELSEGAGITAGRWKADLSPGRFTSETDKAARQWLDSLKGIYSEFRKQADKDVNNVSNTLTKSLGKEGLVALRGNYENKWLRTLVLNHDRSELLDEIHGRIVRRFEPAYMNATSRFGRAHFYAPFKRIGNIKIDTWLFNIIVIWAGSLVLYFVLYYNLIRKFLEYIEDLRLPKAEV